MRKRDILKNFYVNDEENKRLKENAKKTGLTESEYIRSIINGYKPKEQPTETSYEIIKQLKAIGTNFNQIARKANTLNVIDLPFYKKCYAKLLEVIEIIKKEFLDMN